MRVNAPAKINLHLRVGPPAASGFHPLLSWMVTAGLFDTLELRLSDSPGTHVTCDDPSIACDGTNLAARGAAAVLAEAGAIERRVGVAQAAASSGVYIALRKRIPIGAGLGGGSSDGATAMLAMNHLMHLGWPPERLAELSAKLGSDLPFFFHGPSSLCTGRGEIVEPIACPKPRWALLILPPIHMPTPAVYKRFDELNTSGDEALLHPPDWKEWSSLNAETLLPLLINDLEAPAFSLSEQLAQLWQSAEQTLGRIVRMSGSGSSLFSLYDEPGAAASAAEFIRAQLRVRAIAVELCPALASDQPAGAIESV